MAASWAALALADIGKFSAWLSLLAGAAAALVVFLLLARSRGRAHTTPLQKLCTFAALGVALSTLISTREPGELLSGAWDPGVYLHTGAQISQTGALMYRDASLLEMTADEQAVLCRRHPGGMSAPFSGMWYVPAGGVSPQFHHLYPALLAIAHSLGGVRGELLVNPLLNIACIFAFYLLALRFVRAPFALAAAVILALNPAQIWQAKFCTAEMLGQLLLLGGATLFLSSQADDRALTRRLHALLSGLALGLAFLARFDTIIFLAPFVALLIAAWSWLPRRDAAAFLLASLIPCAIHHFIRQPIFSPYYTPMGNLVGPALIALLAAAIVIAITFRNRALRDFAERRATWLRIALAVGFVLWTAFIWLRPFLPDLPIPTADPQLRQMLHEDKTNCYFLSAIFGLGIIAYFAALLTSLLTERNLPRALWVYSSTAVLLVVTTALFNDHYLMWGTRRFIPVIVPLLIIAFAALLERIAGAAQTRPRSLAAAGLLVAVVGLNLPATLSMQRLRDWPGLADWTPRVAAAIPPRARLYSDQWGFVAPLRYLHGITAFELNLSQRDPERRDRLLTVMNAALARGENVWFLTMTGPLGNATERARFPLDSHRIETSRDAIPRTTRPSGGTFVLYELAPSPDS